MRTIYRGALGATVLFLAACAIGPSPLPVAQPAAAG